jgi:hypothetical protein
VLTATRRGTTVKRPRSIAAWTAVARDEPGAEDGLGDQKGRSGATVHSGRKPSVAADRANDSLLAGAYRLPDGRGSGPPNHRVEPPSTARSAVLVGSNARWAAGEEAVFRVTS